MPVMIKIAFQQKRTTGFGVYLLKCSTRPFLASWRMKGRAALKISRVVSSDLPNPSKTMMAINTDAKLDSIFTYRERERERVVMSYYVIVLAHTYPMCNEDLKQI